MSDETKKVFTEEDVARCARIAFDEYALMDAPQLPTGAWQALQVQLARWQNREFGGSTTVELALGVAEEVGELAKAVLKNAQGIRGMDYETHRVMASDAIGDLVIFAMQLATCLRLDFETIVHLTAPMVMRRKWSEDPVNAGMTK